MFPAEQQRELAERLTAFLSQYSRLSDSYIIVRIEVCISLRLFQIKLPMSFERILVFKELKFP